MVDKKSFDVYMKNNGPSNELIDYIYSQISKAYMDNDMDESIYNDILVDTFPKSPELKHKAERARNLTYKVNQQIISTCIHNYIREKTGLSRATMYRDDYTLAIKLIKGKLDVMATMARDV